MTRAGLSRAITREAPVKANNDTTAAATIISGSRDTSKLVRNNASRVARPATCCAIIAAAANIAAPSATLSGPAGFMGVDTATAN